MKRFRYWFVAVAILSVAPFAVGAWENSPWDTVVWKRFVNAVTGKTEIKADINGDGTAEATVNEDGDTTVTGALSVGGFDVDGDGTSEYILDDTAPASAAATGVAGTIVFDATGGYIYFCTATDTWIRVAMATWP